MIKLHDAVCPTCSRTATVTYCQADSLSHARLYPTLSKACALQHNYVIFTQLLRFDIGTSVNRSTRPLGSGHLISSQSTFVAWPRPSTSRMSCDER